MEIGFGLKIAKIKTFLAAHKKVYSFEQFNYVGGGKQAVEQAWAVYDVASRARGIISFHLDE